MLIAHKCLELKVTHFIVICYTYIESPIKVNNIETLNTRWKS